MVARVQRAEEQLSRAMERERLLRHQLELNAFSDESLQSKLGLNLSSLDQQVAKMKDVLQERERAVKRAERLAAQLEEQNKTLKSKLEIVNQKLDDAAEVERSYRIKLKDALESAKNVEEDKAALRASLGQSMQSERDALIKEHTLIQDSLTAQLEALRQDKQRMEEELLVARDTEAFKSTDFLKIELSKIAKELEEKQEAEALLRRDAQMQQAKLKKSAEQVKTLETELEEARQLLSANAAEITKAKEQDQASTSRCELLQSEISALKNEMNICVSRTNEAERTCSSVVDLLLIVKDRVSSASGSAETMASTIKQFLGVLTEPDADGADLLAAADASATDGNVRSESLDSKSPSSKIKDAQKSSVLPGWERVERAVQTLLESPAAGGPGSISQTVLGVEVKESMRRLSKALTSEQVIHEHALSVCVKFYHHPWLDLRALSHMFRKVMLICCSFDHTQHLDSIRLFFHRETSSSACTGFSN